jgi:hypothetical protein
MTISAPPLKLLCSILMVSILAGSMAWGSLLTNYDQYALELVNRARLNPQGEADLYLSGNLNEGLAPGTISTTTK